MSSLAKRALLTVLTVLGIVLLAVGAWFMVNLGTSGSATLSATPASGSVVVLTPSVLNRVDGPVTVTATAKNGGPVFLGLASPGDAEAIVGGADRTTVNGAHVRDWSLVSSRAGAGPAPALAQADIWHHVQQGRGTVRLQVDQADAPESLVVATAQGTPADLSSLTLTVQRPTWFVQSLLAALLGLLAAAAGGVGLWRMRGPSPSDREADEEVTS
ncbi:hypothetical protein [Nostocoides sp. HKS02]|uniref:hypothetical protein n=1 Tax=Nostocoides sp. HKS02 TaxID=1813880 RepID=UPI0012B44982|nr:hypothetical protein [Tetrasphaera sp. HKS02]QGN56775.1 hypothetical protein GKE56_01365 [Tetrasphaera sp. HKS02]